MKTVIPVAGASSRMWPLATQMHKAFIGICGRPLLSHTIDNLSSNGFNDILVIVDKRDLERAEKIRKGTKNAKIEIFVSDDHGGMGAELLKVHDKLGEEFILASGHAVNAGETAAALMKLGDCTASICVCECGDVSEYGKVTLAKEGKTVEKIEEKPKEGGEGLRIVGTYRLNKEFFKSLKAAGNGHYSFEDALSKLVAKGQVQATRATGYQPTLKYPWHLLSLKNFVMERALPAKPVVSLKASVHTSALIEGRVIVEEGAIVMENAVVKGPAYVGRNAVVGTGALVRDYSDLEEKASAGFQSEVKNSLLCEDAHAHRASVEDSILGEHVRLGAGTVIANRRFDRASIKSAGRDGAEKDTGISFFGTAIGDFAAVGVNASIMPGVKLGPKSIVMPNCVAKHDVAEGKTLGD